MTATSLLLFRIRSSVDDVQTNASGSIKGWGIRFPSGICYIDWNPGYFPEHQQYEEPHVSMFASYSDFQEATDGFVETIYAEPIDIDNE